MSYFLRFFAFLFAIAIAGNAHAAGYDCPDIKQYTSCSPGYYMTHGGVYNPSPQNGNACTLCPAGCTCAGTTAAPVCSVTVTISKNGGTGSTSATTHCTASTGTNDITCTCPNGSACALPAHASLTKANSTISGWNSNSGGTGTNYTTTGTFTGATTIYAKWTTCTACAATNASCTLSVVANACTYTTSCNGGFGGGTPNTYNHTCTACADGTYSPAGSNTCSNCSGLGTTGQNPTGGTYSSVSPRDAATTCRYTGTSKTIPGCATATPQAVPWSGSSWSATPYIVTASPGYTASGSGTAAATCSACSASNTDGACGCPAGQRPSGSGCSSCTISCSGVAGYTLGNYNECSGNSNACYRNCTTTDVTGSTTVSGTVTKGGTNTCAATACSTGYTLSGGACVLNTYTITLNKNGGSGMTSGATTDTGGTANATKTCTHGLPCSLPTNNNMINTGKTFTGWGTTAGCTSGVYSETFTGVATRYACWSADAITCTPGYYLPAGSTNCNAPCTAGNYCQGGNFTYDGTIKGLTPCPTGYTSAGGTGDTANTKCYISVAAKKYKTTATGTATADCANGTYSASHISYYNSADSCTACSNKPSGASYTGNSDTNTCPWSQVCASTTYWNNTSKTCATCTAGSACPGVTATQATSNDTGITACTAGNFSLAAAASCTACSSLTGANPGSGTYTSVSPYNASTTCRYTAPSKTITGCASVTSNQVSYSGTAWPASTYSVTANAGYHIANNGTATATCTICAAGTYQGTNGSTATSCTACPTVTSGWTLGTGTGWTSYTSCNQTRNATAISSYCAAGQLRQNAASASTWGASTISTAFTAKSGAYVNGQTCSQCSAGTYQGTNGSTATSCTVCAANTYVSTAGASSCTACASGYSTSGTTAADHDAVVDCKITCSSNHTVATASAQCTACPVGHSNSGGTISQGQTGPSCTLSGVTCAIGYYLPAGSSTCAACLNGSYCEGGYYDFNPTQNQGMESCPAGTGVASDGNRGAITNCYKPCPSKTITNGTATNVQSNVYHDGTAYGTCTYTANCNTDYSPINSPGTDPQCIFDGLCPPGYYCPPGQDPIICPDGGTSEAGSESIEDCYKIEPYADFEYGTGESKCYYRSATSTYDRICEITALTCYAGYHHVFGHACDTVDNGFFSGAGNLNQTECPVGYSGSDDGSDADAVSRSSISDCYKNCTIAVDHSESVTVTPPSGKTYYTSGSYPACSLNVVCNTGYNVVNNNTANPSCTAKVYTIVLNKNGGSGSVVASIDCTFDSGSCLLPDTAPLTRTGYTVAPQWCSTANGGTPCYNAGSAVATNISPTGTAHTLYAKWTPNIYTVNLDHQGAQTSGAPGTVYLKYATNWYSNSAATTLISSLTTNPVRNGWNFVGYYTNTNGGGTQIINSSGGFLNSTDALSMTSTSPATIYAAWSAGTTACPAGEYYNGTICATCLGNYYCQGGNFGTGGGIQGLNICPNGGASLEGSDEIEDCYKIGLDYTATHGTGTQRCFYTSGTGANAIYEDRCDTRKITACYAGYWRALSTDIDCTAVGYGNYSPAGDMDYSSCQDGGTTATETSASDQACFKTGLPYTATNGAGTQRCFYSSGTGASAIYQRACDTQLITSCKAGYWRELPADTDCSAVGIGNYSGDTAITRSVCPDGGTTATATSSSSGQCYKSGLPHIADHGSGTKLCFYNSSSGIYDSNCNTITITDCMAGYYRVAANSVDCDEAGYGYYSEIADITRTRCPRNGLTEEPTSDSVDLCFLEQLICPITNGSGTQTCFYTSGTGATAVYDTGCSTCLLEDCDTGFTQVGNTCIVCPEDSFCNVDGITACKDIGDGTYIHADAGTTDSSGCYKNCALGTNAASMTGRDYYTGADTCAIETCMPGYALQGGLCVACPAGKYCDGTTPGGESCSSLGDGTWNMSAPNAKTENDCYKLCPDYALTGGGTAHAENDSEFYDKDCTYSCVSSTGNPGEVQNGECVETSCDSDYEMVKGKCQPCNRENALSYKPGANCEITACVYGYHPNGQACEANILPCTAPNATEATRTWSTSTKAFGICTIKTCEDGYHISSNACVLDEQDCSVSNGIGKKQWDSIRNKWSECQVTYCKPGYTSDRSETNELTEACGQCKNKFGVFGELVASSYVAGCEIASCLYQGELYNLEGNECVPICSPKGYEDETGTMTWDTKNNKCIRQCKDGFTAW